jgi:hypothetical protein
MGNQARETFLHDTPPASPSAQTDRPVQFDSSATANYCTSTRNSSHFNEVNKAGYTAPMAVATVRQPVTLQDDKNQS